MCMYGACSYGVVPILKLLCRHNNLHLHSEGAYDIGCQVALEIQGSLVPTQISGPAMTRFAIYRIQAAEI